MSTSNEFESRRRERRRRERLRKKRIRTAVILIILIALIAIICIAVSTMKKGNNEEQLPADGTITETMQPSESTIPTVAPVQTNTLSIPPASEENDLLQIIADSGQTKRCYLTFDDGPTENITPQILDVLRRYNAKATFFQVGSLINSNPEMARRVYEEGHLIANHSQGHNYEKLYASTETFITEIQDCENSIRSVMDGEEPFLLMRFPGGSYNAGDHASMKQKCKETLKENNFYYIDWNSLNGDAEGKTKNAQELFEYFKQTSTGYNNLIVLMHDASAKQATADALPLIMDYLISEGYTFHRLDDIDYQSGATTATIAPAEDGTVSNDTSTESESSSTTTSSSTNSPSPDNTPSTTSEATTSEATSRPTTPPNTSSGAIIIQ